MKQLGEELFTFKNKFRKMLGMKLLEAEEGAGAGAPSAEGEDTELLDKEQLALAAATERKTFERGTPEQVIYVYTDISI